MNKPIFNLFKKIEPEFSELSVFYIAVTFIITFLANITQIINWYKSIGLFLLIAFVAYLILASLLGTPYITGIAYFISGFAGSLSCIFKKRKPPANPKLKKFVAFFAVATNFLTGMICVFYLVFQAFEINKPWLYIFPAWTFMNTLLLLPKCQSIEKNETVIAEDDSSFAEIIFGLIVLLAVFAICNYAFKIYWPFTLSICVVYATICCKFFGHIFMGKKVSNN